jgi:RNA polymerase sigma factor (sigma-70 family)
MRDRDMVAAIVAGDPAGLAAAYDRYAADLHAYCRSLLTQPADAAEVVRDTFIIATAEVTRLRDPDLARPWLFAVARNECRRRLRAHAPAAWPALVGDVGDLGDAPGAPADPNARSGRPTERELVDAAIRSLDPAERDAVELCMRHDLDDVGLAATLGISRGSAHVLAVRARRKFETSLGALVVARAGPQFCPDLGAMLDGWDGKLTPVLRRQLDAHIRHCAVCGERKRRKLQTTMLFGLGAAPPLPEEVWRQILGLVTGSTPGSAASRAHIAARAQPFARSGFPVSADGRAAPGARGASARPVLAALAVVAIFAAISAGTVIMTGLPHGGRPAHRPGSAPGGHASEPAPVAQAPLESVSTTAAATRQGAHPVSAPGRATTVPAPTAPGTPTLTPGTLTEWPATVTLRRSKKAGPPTGSFTLTANGGPVAQFSVAVPADHAGDLTVTPAAGSLAAGQSIQVSVTLRKDYRGPLQAQLLVQPGGLAVTVVYGPHA